MKSSLPLLFSFDFISLAFVSALDQEQHILLDSPSPGTFRVVKNGAKLRKLFSCFEKHQLIPICYTNKKNTQTSPILNAIHPTLKWVFIQSNREKYLNLSPNRAILLKLQSGQQIIVYGQGFSACEGKQQLWIAINSAFGIGVQKSKRGIIIYENNTQQIAKLKQNESQFVFSQIPNTEEQLLQFENKIGLALKQSDKKQDYKEFREFVQTAPTLQDARFLTKIKEFHYFENTKYVTLSSGFDLSNAPPVYRIPNSQSICSLVFRYLGDKQLYVASSDFPSKLGGDYQYSEQENKILASCIHQTLLNKDLSLTRQNSGYLSLPLYLSQFNMKKAMVKSYNKAKALFIIRPYIKGLKTVSEMLDGNEQVIELWQQRRLHGQIVKGLGRIIAISLLCNEELDVKGIFQMTTLYSDKQSKYAQQKSKNQEKQQAQYLECCRINFGNCFKKAKLNKNFNLQDIEVNVLSKKCLKLKIISLHSQYISQIQSTISQIYDDLPLIEAVFTYHKWAFKKQDEFMTFKEQLLKFWKMFSQKSQGLEIQLPIQNKMRNISRINPMFLNYVIAGAHQYNFDYFTKVAPLQLSEIYYKSRNIYDVKMKETQNFIIFGQCVPIYSLMRWIKTLHPTMQISYISLMHHKKDAYEKKAKLAKSYKKSTFFIIDHCQIQQAGGQLPEGKTIADQSWGMRTIFIYRLKTGSCKRLKIVHDPLTSGGKASVAYGKITQTNQQLLKTIFTHFSKVNIQESLFNTYQKAISIYIRNKWLTLGMNAGICDEQIIKIKLKKLVKLISLKNNRFSSILENKQFNSFDLSYRGEGELYTFSSRLESNLLLHSNLANTQHTLRDSGSGVNIAYESQISQLQHLKKVPKSQIILYCLPIYVMNQRVFLMHDLYEFLNAFYLCQQIIEGSWTGNLQGEQLEHFVSWFPHMNSKQENRHQKIKIGLLKLLQKFAEDKAKKNSSGLQIMGMSNSFLDCLELMKKVDMKQYFGKVDDIFNFDSPMQKVLQVQDKLYVVTKRGSIYSIISCVQKQKVIRKVEPIYQHKIQAKQQIKQACIGLYMENRKVIGSFVDVDCQNQVIVHKQMQIRIRQVIRVNENTQNKQIKLKTKQINESQKVQIIKIVRIKPGHIIFVLQNGRVLMGQVKINEEEAHLQKVKCIMDLSQLYHTQDQQPSKVFRNDEVRIDINTEDTNNMGLAISLLENVGQNKKQNRLYFAYLTILEDQTQGYASKLERKGFITNKYEIKTFGIHIITEKKEKISLQILVFEAVTDALNIWQINLQDPKTIIQEIVKLENPHHKYYKIQNDPIHIYRSHEDGIVYVASKVGFIKRMILNSVGK